MKNKKKIYIEPSKCIICTSTDILPNTTCSHYICHNCSYKIKPYYIKEDCVFCDNERISKQLKST